MDRVTIYRQSDMLGIIVKYEARSCDIVRRPYAQYSSAIQVRFVKKGGRTERGFVETYKPRLLVLEGWGHPEPAGLFDGGKTTEFEGGSFSQAKHMAFDGGYAADFDSMIAKHIADTGAKVAFDARGEHIS